MNNENRFYKNDRVRISDNYFDRSLRGKAGTVTLGSHDNVFVPGLTGVRIDNGTMASISASHLERVPAKPEVGKEIQAKDIKIGMTIKVSLTTTVGDSYEQISSKQGVVTKITKGFGESYVPVCKPSDGGSDITLSFGARSQVFTLVKDAPEVDEIAEALNALNPGSVVQIEDGGAGNFVLTYVKSTGKNHAGVSLWTVTDSRYVHGSTSMNEEKVRERVTSLDQIVVKL
jgi:hypothetical protein